MAPEKMTASFGAVQDGQAGTIGDLRRDVDVALYKAKPQ
jgi:hypothetical protein